jgi:hypothetical protein
MHSVSSVRVSTLLIALGLAACAPTPSSTPSFLSVTLALPNQKNANGVFLNEPLTFFFSSELDRSSVTGESLSIRSQDNVPARGVLAVNGNSITFTPAPVLASDLSDGGYRPDTAYTVEIHGFPWVDGLRGTGGEPLRATYTYTFKTVSAAVPLQTLLFADAEPEKTRPLAFFPPPSVEYTVGTDDAIYLDSDKPIDPTSMRDADFVLRRKDTGELVAVRARLIENENEARARPKPRHVQSIALETFWESQPRAALIELVPVKKLGLLSSWRLVPARDETGADAGGPRDFSGHPLWGPTLALPISVGYRGLNAGKGVLFEDFVTREFARSSAVPGADGLAHWGTNGRVEVRFPAAAGLGTAGPVVLAGALGTADLHATSLTVKDKERVTLSSQPGLVVLRAQGALRIAGQVTREVVRKPNEGESDPPLDLYTSDERLQHTVTLSRWLEEMRATNRTVTVLVAGGDLVIEPDAELRANTPIVLVAGGLVRVLGRLRATNAPNGGAPSAVFVLGEGGVGGESGTIQPPMSPATLLEMDPPRDGNPLREVLHYAVLSALVPKQGSVSAWTSADAGGSKITTNGNRWSVRYVREMNPPPASIDEFGAVDRPQTLEPVGPIQMLIELWVAPGPTFDPPFVDFVRLTWEQKLLSPGPGGAR